MHRSWFFFKGNASHKYSISWYVLVLDSANTMGAWDLIHKFWTYFDRRLSSHNSIDKNKIKKGNDAPDVGVALGRVDIYCQVGRGTELPYGQTPDNELLLCDFHHKTSALVSQPWWKKEKKSTTICKILRYSSEYSPLRAVYFDHRRVNKIVANIGDCDLPADKPRWVVILAACSGSQYRTKEGLKFLRL